MWLFLKVINSQVWWLYLLWGKASCHWCTWDSRRWHCGSLQTSPSLTPPTTTWWRRCRCTSSSNAGAGRRCRPSSGRRWPGLRAPEPHEVDKGPGEDMRWNQQSWCRGAQCATDNVFHKWLRENVLTCIMDLSEYISSMVLWMRVMLPWRSGGENSIHKSFSEECSEEVYYFIYFWAYQVPSEVSSISVLSVGLAHEDIEN